MMINEICESHVALQRAVDEGDESKMVSIAKDNKIGIDDVDAFLLQKSSTGDWKFVKAMLIADPRNSEGIIKILDDCLMLACESGRTKVVEVLIEDGRASPLPHDESSCCLSAACENESVGIVKIILDDGRASPTNHICMSLGIISDSRHGQIKQLLIEHILSYE